MKKLASPPRSPRKLAIDNVKLRVVAPRALADVSGGDGPDRPPSPQGSQY